MLRVAQRRACGRHRRAGNSAPDRAPVDGRRSPWRVAARPGPMRISSARRRAIDDARCHAPGGSRHLAGRRLADSPRRCTGQTSVGGESFAGGHQDSGDLFHSRRRAVMFRRRFSMLPPTACTWPKRSGQGVGSDSSTWGHPRDARRWNCDARKLYGEILRPEAVSGPRRGRQRLVRRTRFARPCLQQGLAIGSTGSRCRTTRIGSVPRARSSAVGSLACRAARLESRRCDKMLT